MNIIPFFKEAIHGEVKTRLGKTIGFRTAALIYKRLLEHNLNIIYSLKIKKNFSQKQKPNCSVSDFFLNFSLAKQSVKIFPYIAKKPSLKFTYCFEQDVKLNIQAPGDLGEKMHLAMTAVYRDHPTPTIIIGSDTLDLSLEKLMAAIIALKKSKNVIAPTTDGGYYLIGLKKPVPELFLNRTWSHAQVFEEQIALFKKLKVPCKILAKGNDLDTYKDLKELCSRNPYLFNKLTKGLLTPSIAASFKKHL